MKVLLYFEGEKILAKSGIGRALEHQQKALEHVGVKYTLNHREKEYDILHINTYGLFSHKMVNQAKKEGKKVIYHAHSTQEDFQNSFVGSNQLAPLFKNYLMSLYQKADCLITPTPYSKQLLEGYGLTMPIYSISNGINLQKYQKNSRKEEAFYRYFQLKRTQKIVISVGLFFDRKGILDFVEVAKKRPEYIFIWFGHTPLYAIPKHIRKIIQHHPKNVFFPGYIKGEVLEGAYTACDLFFFPSYEETEGIVVLEALASQQHVLLRDIPVYKGWLKDKKNCYMGKNNEEFLVCMDHILNHTFSNLTQEGYQVAKEKSIEKIGNQLKQVYETVLKE